MPRAALHTALLVTIGVLIATGTIELFGNGAWMSWVELAHSGSALALVPLLCWKTPVVTRSLKRRHASFSVWPGLLLMAVTIGLAFSGAAWLAGLWRAWDLAGNSLLAIHLYLYFVLPIPLLLHVWLRWERLKWATFRGRRTVLRLGSAAAVALAGTLAFSLLAPWLRRVPAIRRFTGSFLAGTGSGNDFPVTAFLSDDPAPLDLATWRLRITGTIARPLLLTFADLTAGDRLTATVDCTGGWYAERAWSGMSVGRLLESAGIHPEAVFVLFRSVTGHFTILPLAEARGALLATSVGDEPLAHGHGFPLRLVAPDRRGFAWVKWVVEVRVV